MSHLWSKACFIAGRCSGLGVRIVGFGGAGLPKPVYTHPAPFVVSSCRRTDSQTLNPKP